MACLTERGEYSKTFRSSQIAAQIAAALDLFLLDVGRYPTEDEGIEALVEEQTAISNWRGPYLRKKEIPLDPWGRPYAYLNIAAAGGIGDVRKDKNLNPLNTDFDLYSLGEDGASASPLTAKNSRDDIVRANNGAYIGLGEDY